MLTTKVSEETDAVFSKYCHSWGATSGIWDELKWLIKNKDFYACLSRTAESEFWGHWS